MMRVGVSVRENIGVGDKLQYSSLPENYFRATGLKLLDMSRPWFWDFNPYVIRDDEATPEKVIDLWNWPHKYEWPRPQLDKEHGKRPDVYLTNAEIWASLLGVKHPTLARPRLYRFENYPFEKREWILFHPFGKSHGAMPDYMIEHVIKKYGPTYQLYQVGLSSDPDLGIPRLYTENLWSLAEVISKARLFIGIDSGPAWIAACYPDVQVKKVRVRVVNGQRPYCGWVPLEIDNFHSHWDDRAFQVFTTTDDDCGFMLSWKKL